jgi:outer membrane protein assembly factor BamB
MIRPLLISFLLACFAISATAADWPQFQGPNRDGSSPEKNLLREWPDAGPRVLWRQKVKPGWSAPSLVGDDVYVCSTEEARGEAETVACLSAVDGEIRWRDTYEVGPYWKRNIGWARGGFRATPCIDGDRLFTLGSIGHLRCYNRKSGKVLWQQNLWDQWNPSGEKGYVFSPITVDGKLILWYSDGVTKSNQERPDVEKEREQFLVLCRALDPANGKQLWEFQEPHRPESRMGEGQTPGVARFGDDNCIVVNGNAQLKALRVSDGKEIWKYNGPEPLMRGTTIPTPLVLDNFIVNVPDADPMQVVEVDRSRPDLPTRTLWARHTGIYNPIHQFRHHDGYLYGFSGVVEGSDEKAASDSKLNLICLDLKTGKLMWKEPGFQCGVAMTIADGLLFVRSYQMLRLVEATPSGYKLRGQVQTHKVWKPTLNLLDFVQPVLSNGKLFIRTPEEIICYLVGG